ncbi:MAG: Rieske 2Fe-2S domain-containing protein [Gammaproteobacteria bacterium]
MSDTVLRQHWLAVATSREIRKPVARIVLGVPLVIARSRGAVFALADRCAHRCAPLSAGRVRNGLLQCPYHGWQFDTEGRCRYAPGLADGTTPLAQVPAYGVIETDGIVFVCLADKPLAPPAPLRPDGFDAFQISYEVRAELADVLENLLDATHTPWVHRGLLRSPTRHQRFAGRLRIDDRAAEVEYTGESGQAGLVSRLLEHGRTVSYGRYIPPATAEIEYRSARGTELVVAVHCTPVEPGRTRAIATVLTRKARAPALIKRAVLEPMLRIIAEQDRRILERQYRNRSRFRDVAYHIWRTDLLRPSIDHWLEHGCFAPTLSGRRIELEL